MSKKRFNGESSDSGKFELLRDEDVMKTFSICRTTLFNWRKQGEIPFRKVGGTNYYLKKAIENMFLQHGLAS